MSEAKKRRIILIGGHELGCLCLDWLVNNEYCVVLCIGRKDDRSIDQIFPSLLKRAKAYQIQSIQPQDLNNPDVLKTAERINADIVLSFHNNMIFRGGWLKLLDNKLGIVNAHHGPLPRYGGFWPEMWAIWNAEKDFGVTLHYVDRSIDGGDIIGQKPVVISKEDTRKTLYDKCTQATFELFKNYLDPMLTKKVMGRKQDLSKRTYYKRELPNGGFVDFTWDQEKIQRFYRAISFYPFVGPKLRIGNRVISSVDEDLPFLKPVRVEQLDY